MKVIIPMILWFAVATGLPAASLSYLEQIPVDTNAKMREVERYQLKVAEKYHLNRQLRFRNLSMKNSSRSMNAAQLLPMHN